MGFRVYFNNIKSILGLSLSLAKANFKLRNEGSYLGILWYLLEPLLLFLIILLIKNSLAIEAIESYPIYLLLGIIMFNFFSGATNLSTSSIISNSGFIKSIKIPYESLVISAVIQAVFSHLFEILAFIFFMIFFKINLIYLVFYLVILFFFIIFTLGLSFILAILGAYFNDMRHVWTVIMRLVWFVTPVFYVLQPGTKVYIINLFNPLYHFIDVARDILIYHVFPSWICVFMILFFSITFLALGIFIFLKYKSKLAEVV